MITIKCKVFFNRLLEPIGHVLVRLHVKPNQITLLGLVLGMAVCGLFIWNQNVSLFFILILVTGLFDALDGVVARLSGQATKFGAYLDAVCDRFFEGFVALAVAMVTGHWVLVFLLYVGFVGISYGKARAAMEVPVSNEEWPDLMERMERDLMFIAGLWISDMTKAEFGGHSLFFWILIALNLLVYLTVVQRILRAKGIIESRS